MPRRTGVILFAHGSRDPLWRRPIEAVRLEMERTDPTALVRCAYLELCEPDLAEAVRELRALQIDALAIVPMFLGTGRHAREDLPRLLEALRTEHLGLDLQLQAPIGEDPRMVALMARIAGENRWPPGTP